MFRNKIYKKNQKIIEILAVVLSAGFNVSNMAAAIMATASSRRTPEANYFVSLDFHAITSN